MKLNPSKNIEIIYDIIKTQQGLKFLQETAALCKKRFYNDDLKKFLIRKLPQNIVNVNGLYVEDGYAHFNYKEMDAIFFFMQGILNYPSGNIDNSAIIYPLKNVLDTVIENINDARNNERLDILKLFMAINKKEGFLRLTLFLQHLSVKEYTKKDRKSNFAFKYTTFAVLLGTFMLELSLSADPIFNNLIKFFKGQSFAISTEEDDNFAKYVKALLVDDIEQSLKYYKGLEIENYIKNHLILQTLVKHYVLSNLFKQYHRNNIPVSTLLKVLTEHAAYNYNNASYDLNKALLQIISPLIDECSSKKLKPAPLFIIQTYYKVSSKKSQKMVSIEPMALNEFISRKAGNKPYLSVKNIHYLKNVDLIGVNKVVLESIYENKSRFIHSHLDLNLKYSKNSYLKDADLLTKYHIDINYYTYFLQSLTNIQQGNCTFQERIDFITSIYNIEQDLISTDVEEENLIITLLNFAVEFDPMAAKEFDKSIDDMLSTPKNKYYRRYHTIFSKIRNQRLILMGLLTDCLLYVHFKFFLMDSYLDSRGRFYCNLDFLNPRNYHIAKAFVKPYIEGQITAENFDVIKNVVKEHIDSDEIKKEIITYDYSQYKKQLSQIMLENIADYFKIDLKQIPEIWEPIENKDRSIICNFTYVSLLRKYLKKKNRLPYIQSVLLSYCIDSIDNVKAYIEYDATTSGLQMCSILLNSESLGIESNIIGTQKADIYSNVTTECSKEVDKIKDFISQITKFSENHIHWPSLDKEAQITSNKLIIHKKEYDEIIQNNSVEEGFLFADTEKSTYFVEIAMKVYEKLIQIPNNDYLMELCDKALVTFSWLLCKKDEIIIKKEAHRFKYSPEDLTFMLIIRSCFRFLLHLQRTQLLFDTSFFEDRTLFKNSIMTYFYNSRSRSRNDKMKEYLNEKLSSTKQMPKELYDDTNAIAIVLDKFFIKYLGEKLPDNAKIFCLSNILAKHGKLITIKTPHVTIKYFPKQQEINTVETPTYKKRRGHQLTLRKTLNLFDSNEFKNAFIPNNIHSMDAYIAQSFIKRFLDMNSTLRKLQLNVQIHYFTNHDTFGSTTFGPFLKYIIEDCYLSLIHEEPITWIFDSLDDDTKRQIEALLASSPKYRQHIKRLNPHFVK